MTLKHYDFESGTDGLTATTLNTGAAQITLNGGSVTFASTARITGDLGLRMTAPASGDATARFNATAAATKMSFSVGVIIGTTPTLNRALFTLRHSAGVAFRAFVHTSGTLQIDGATQAGQTDTGVVLTPGSKFRIEVTCTVGTTVSNGQVSVAVYAGNSATPLEPATESSTFNLGTAPIAAADIIVSDSRVLQFDDVRFNDGSTTPLGPVPNNKVATNSVRPFDTTDNPGAFALVGGAGTIAGALADETDTTYIQSPGAPNAASVTVAMDPLTAGPVTVKVRHAQSEASPSIVRKYEILQGSTVKATRSVTLTQAWVDYTFTTTTSETNAISIPRNNLSLRITDTSL